MLRQSKKLDRSTKPPVSNGVPKLTDQQRKRLCKTLPSSTSLFQSDIHELEDKLAWYLYRIKNPQQFPTDSQVATELEKFVRDGTNLSDTLDRMSEEGQRLLYGVSPWPRARASHQGRTQVAHCELRGHVDRLIEHATVMIQALRSTSLIVDGILIELPRNSRGRPPDAGRDDVLRAIIRIWKKTIAHKRSPDKTTESVRVPSGLVSFTIKVLSIVRPPSDRPAITKALKKLL